MKKFVYVVYDDLIKLNSGRFINICVIGKASPFANKAKQYKLIEKKKSRYFYDPVPSESTGNCHTQRGVEIKKKSEIQELFQNLNKNYRPIKLGGLINSPRNNTLFWGSYDSLKDANQAFNSLIETVTNEQIEDEDPFKKKVMDIYWKQKRKELDHNLSGISYEDGWIKINPIIIILIIFTLILILTLPS